MKRHSELKVAVASLGLLCLFYSNLYASGLSFNKPSLDSVVLRGERTSRTVLVSRVSLDSDTIYVDSSGTDMIFTDGSNTNVTLTSLVGAPANATYITQTPNGTLTNEQALNSLTAAPLSVDASGVVTSGTIQVGRGGTGLTSGTSGGVPYFSAAQAISSSAALTANAVVIGGGAGVTPSTITADTTANQSLMSTTTSPAFRQLVSGDVTGAHTVLQGGTGVTSYTKGDLLVADSATGLIKLTVGSNGQILSADSAASSGVKWSNALSVGGTDPQLQFNNASAFGGTSLLTWDSTRSRLSLGPNTSNVISMDVSGSSRNVPIQLTDGANIALDASKSNFFYVILTGQPRTLSNPTNGAMGQKIVLLVSQDSVGTRKMGFGTAYKFGSDITTFDASTVAGTNDYVGIIYNGVSWDVVSTSKGFL